jgi:dTDP-3-amino-2,3,6-trideoxy-4-keto-D-glucose/dTDP-3-amino-3,4,6-trideoxy-alpha-D-glucose/dTDP-2,6-dideoxy-D-kanosamine transaminase
MIKCNNVQEQAQDRSGQIFERWQALLQSGDFILGDEVLMFESWMSDRCGGAHAVALNSGTDALFLALRALKIGPGDKVITCADTFVATVGAIVSAGTRPVLADVGDDELMDVDTIAPHLSDRTKAIIPVYLRGRPLDIDAIIDLCRSRGMAGCWPPAIRRLPNTRVSRAIMAWKHVTNRSGSALTLDSTRLDSLQAAALNVKAQYLDQWLKRRVEIAAFYDDVLSAARTGTDLGGSKPGNSYYHYVV